MRINKGAILIVLFLCGIELSVAQIKMFKNAVRPTKGISVTYPSKQISIAINKNANEVYQFISTPENMPRWAAGLSQSQMVKSGDDWIAESPMGKVKVRFAEKNKFGVVDHDVTLPSGETNHNPLRVVRNGDGSEVIFTLYRLPKVSDADFDKDAAAVKKDLETLKSLLEK
ncbi:SRPBCC family protein [Bdellovibrio sp. SKB1291214]|uniref:SRPBCC family protein n=1 Tax=Bdellovibrio sp. SKB1291214 TaxID=1732569 RepID=UPI001C3DC73E|nr:SRPBCC family protein [Bdellovibrio sp. SKB1291214]UYL10268.1 SRPBCC family protein [Bdellovibrio sp. SKB1291214]